MASFLWAINYHLYQIAISHGKDHFGAPQLQDKPAHGYAPRLISASFASTMPTTPSVKSRNSAWANDTSTRSTATSRRYPPPQLKVVGSAPEAYPDLRATLRRQIREIPLLDVPFAGVSPIPAAPKEATTRKTRDPNPPFAAPPMSDCVGREQMISIKSSVLESLVANTVSLATMISNREHALHEKGFDSFSPQPNPNTSSLK